MSERLDAILARLPHDDAVYVSALVEPPWKQRQRRLSVRDDAIRAALALLADDPRPAARLAHMLSHTVNQIEPVRELLLAIIASNNGQAMTERQLRNIATGSRTPAPWK